jgi:peptidoglycan hydrolase-like protein with peptidoglycan-binding domain
MSKFGTRLLRFGCAGEDVLTLKRRLFEMGFYDPKIKGLKTDTFGSDTLRAVLACQTRYGLAADGIVGPLTCAALFPQETANELSTGRACIPAQIGDTAAASINAALETADPVRKGLALDALQFAFDAQVPREYPVSLYIRGGNLYNEDLTRNVITLARIAAGAKRQPEYYDGGRREMMERALLENPSITGADCSGGVVGLLRHAGLVKPGFDLAADGFATSAQYRPVESGALQPGDLLYKSGHVGLYAGGGYAVEWMGGAYGCQLTRLDARRGWNFVTQKNERFGAWTKFLRANGY